MECEKVVFEVINCSMVVFFQISTVDIFSVIQDSACFYFSFKINCWSLSQLFNIYTEAMLLFTKMNIQLHHFVSNLIPLVSLIEENPSVSI